MVYVACKENRALCETLNQTLDSPQNCIHGRSTSSPRRTHGHSKNLTEEEKEGYREMKWDDKEESDLLSDRFRLIAISIAESEGVLLLSSCSTNVGSFSCVSCVHVMHLLIYFFSKENWNGDFGVDCCLCCRYGIQTFEMRLLTESKGYRLDDTGLFLATHSSGGKRGVRGTTSLHLNTEKEVFDFLGFPWLEPYERNL